MTDCPRMTRSPRSDWPSQSYKVVTEIPSFSAAALVVKSTSDIAIVVAQKPLRTREVFPEKEFARFHAVILNELDRMSVARCDLWAFGW